MSKQNLYNESELLSLVAGGDETAFRVLFERWYNKLGGYVIKWTGSEAVAQDIVQEVFLKIWTNRTNLYNVDNFDRYLFTVSRNHTLNALRNAQRQRIKFKQWLLDTRHQESLTIAELDTNPDYYVLIEQAVAELPGQQKKVFELKYIEGKKYESIGREMGISSETARKHMQLASKSIIKYIKDNLPALIIISDFL